MNDRVSPTVEEPVVTTASAPVSAPPTRKFAAHCIFFACLYVLMGYRQLLPVSDLMSLLVCLIPFALGVAALQFLVRRVFPSSHKAEILLTVCLLYVCFFGDFKMLGERRFGAITPALASATWLLPIWTVLFGAIGAVVITRRGPLDVLQRYLGVVAAALLLTEVFDVMRHPPQAPPPPASLPPCR